VYKQGNVVFVADGSALLSPVGNRVSYFDLLKSVSLERTLANDSNKSFTFAFEHRKNIERIALSPQGTLLLSVDEGEGHFR
jgi:periodic tryptophan protein 2